MLESGKKYKTRNGKKVVKVYHDPESIGDHFPFKSSCGYSRYTREGVLLRSSKTDWDLVEEVPNGG